jgi:hypothetical protein
VRGVTGEGHNDSVRVIPKECEGSRIQNFSSVIISPEPWPKPIGGLEDYFSSFDQIPLWLRTITGWSNQSGSGWAGEEGKMEI